MPLVTNGASQTIISSVCSDPAVAQLVSHYSASLETMVRLKIIFEHLCCVVELKLCSWWYRSGDTTMYYELSCFSW